MLLKNYPEGSDVTILNNFYCYPKKNEETGKWDNGSMTLIYICLYSSVESALSASCSSFLLPSIETIKSYKAFARV